MQHQTSQLILFTASLTILLFISLIHHIEASSKHTPLINEFGCLEQSELACKATSRFGSLLAVHNNDIALMFTCLHDDEWSDRSTIAPLLRMHRISNSVGMGLTGTAPDGQYLADEMMTLSLDEEMIFRSKPRIQRLVKKISAVMHERTVTYTSRPFSARLCIIGCNEGTLQDFTPVVMEIDPLGNYHECKLCCLGRFAEDMLAQWNYDFDPIDMTLPQMASECIRVLRSTSKAKSNPHALSQAEGLASDGINISFVGRRTPFKFASRMAVKRAIDNNDLTLLLNEISSASTKPSSPSPTPTIIKSDIGMDA